MINEEAIASAASVMVLNQNSKLYAHESSNKSNTPAKGKHDHDALIIVMCKMTFVRRVSRCKNGDTIINNINEIQNFKYVMLTQDWHPEDHTSFSSTNPMGKLFNKKNVLWRTGNSASIV